MHKEQKEGVVILAISATTLIIFALLTDWRYEFSSAKFFIGFTRECTSVLDQNCWPLKEGDRDITFGFLIRFQTCLIFLLPVFCYGILRSLNIVKRLFSFEEKMFKFIKE